jgi:hypothetical protein
MDEQELELLKEILEQLKITNEHLEKIGKFSILNQ